MASHILPRPILRLPFRNHQIRPFTSTASYLLPEPQSTMLLNHLLPPLHSLTQLELRSTISHPSTTTTTTPQTRPHTQRPHRLHRPRFRCPNPRRHSPALRPRRNRSLLPRHRPRTTPLPAFPPRRHLRTARPLPRRAAKMAATQHEQRRTWRTREHADAESERCV